MEKKRTLLVVDNQEMIRALLRAAFEKQGCRVLEADGGCDALRQLDRNDGEIQAVITDLKMDKGTGFDLLSVMRNYPSLSDIPVIVVSAHEDLTELTPRLLQSGARYVFAKPFSLNELLAAVDALLGEPNTA